MKISPLPSTGVPTFGAGAEGSRTMTLKTNANPGQTETPVGQNLSQEEETKQGSEAAEPISPQLALLAKQRRKLQLEIKAFEEKKAKEAPGTQPDMVSKAQLKSDWLRMVLDAGLTWDDLTKSVVDYQSGPNAELQTLRNELKEIREGQDKRWTDYETQQETQARTEMRREAQNLVNSGDEFEAIKFYGKKGLDHVDDLIYRVWKKDNVLIPVHEACQRVEEHLVNLALKQAQLKKVQSQLAPPPQEQAPPAQVPPMQRQTRTLTNRLTASTPTSARQRALAAFNGTLKR